MNRSRTRWLDSTLVRLAVGAVAGLAAAGTMAGLGLASWAAVSGWIMGSGVFNLATWLRVRGLDAAEVSTHAQREDVGRVAGHVLLLVACAASVVGVGLLLLASVPGERNPVGDALVGVLAVVASWFTAHMVFTLHYARLHVLDPGHGIDFGETRPTYRDFAYVAYTIGMTYQVSDTTFRSTALRTTALRHALLSYFLGVVVIACTINVVVQLASAHI